MGALLSLPVTKAAEAALGILYEVVHNLGVQPAVLLYL